MKLVGYFTSGEIAYSFALPVFEEAGKHYFQAVRDGFIQGFEPVESSAEELTVLPIELSRAVSSGDLPLYVYLKQGSQVVVGTKPEIDTELLAEVKWISVPLFSKLEMTIFLQDPALFKYYSDRIQSKLYRQYPDYQGSITVEGPSRAEPTHEIKIASMAPENILLAIKLRLPEADAILRSLLEGSRPTVRAMVMGFGGSQEMADDILQDSFTAFLDLVDAGKFRSEAKISTTIFAIAKNKAISALRRNLSSPFSDAKFEDDNEDQSASADTPESELIQEERILLIKELVEGLESDAAGCTKLLLARYQDQTQSNEALAKAFGFKNASVVSAKLHSCKRSMMKRIAMDPVLLGKAMDFLNSAHELRPLIERFADRLPVIFAYLQGNLDEESQLLMQNELDGDVSLQHLTQAMQTNFSR